MAEFHLWGKENLVKFAEEADAEMHRQWQEIVRLTDDLKTVQKHWREAIAKSAAPPPPPAVRYPTRAEMVDFYRRSSLGKTSAKEVDDFTERLKAPVSPDTLPPT